MKQFPNILKKIAGITIFTFVTFTVIFYIWLTQKWKDTLSKKSFKEFIAYIDTIPDLPERFYKIYSSVNEYDETTTTFWTLLKQPWNMFILKTSDHICPCMEVNYGFVTNTFDRWSVALELEKYVTPKKCLNAYLNSVHFGESIRGIKRASNFYFKKELIELSDDEIYALVIMIKAPTRYSPLRNPELLNEEINKYKHFNN